MNTPINKSLCLVFIDKAIEDYQHSKDLVKLLINDTVTIYDIWDTMNSLIDMRTNVGICFYVRSNSYHSNELKVKIMDLFDIYLKSKELQINEYLYAPVQSFYFEERRNRSREYSNPILISCINRTINAINIRLNYLKDFKLFVNKLPSAFFES